MLQRTVIALATTLLIAGCQSPEPTKTSSSIQPDKTPAKAPTASASPAAATAKPAAAPSAKEYYEVTRNGKTYVFGSLDAVLAFRKSNTLPANMTEKPHFGPAGETVVVQGGGAEPALLAEYQKAHPAKK